VETVILNAMVNNFLKRDEIIIKFIVLLNERAI